MMEDNLTVGEIISQVRSVYKADSSDAFTTDRFFYNLFRKYADLLLRRKWMENKLDKAEHLFTWLPKIPLIEVDKIEADCVGIKTGCVFKRSVNKLPPLVSFDSGEVIKTVSTVDLSKVLVKTTPKDYVRTRNLSTFKYNREVYYWIKNGYLYIPEVEYLEVTAQILPSGPIKGYCLEDDAENNNCKPKCKLFQESKAPYTRDILADAMGMLRNDMALKAQLPSDNQDNLQNVLR